MLKPKMMDHRKPLVCVNSVTLLSSPCMIQSRDLPNSIQTPYFGGTSVSRMKII